MQVSYLKETTTVKFNYSFKVTPKVTPQDHITKSRMPWRHSLSGLSASKPAIQSHACKHVLYVLTMDIKRVFKIKKRL